MVQDVSAVAGGGNVSVSDISSRSNSSGSTTTNSSHGSNFNLKIFLQWIGITVLAIVVQFGLRFLQFEVGYLIATYSMIFFVTAVYACNCGLPAHEEEQEDPNRLRGAEESQNNNHHHVLANDAQDEDSCDNKVVKEDIPKKEHPDPTSTTTIIEAHDDAIDVSEKDNKEIALTMTQPTDLEEDLLLESQPTTNHQRVVEEVEIFEQPPPPPEQPLAPINDKPVLGQSELVVDQQQQPKPPFIEDAVGDDHDAILPPPTQAEQQSQRLYFLDNLKIFLTFIVLEHHVACSFGACGEGIWFLSVGEYQNPFQFAIRGFIILNQSYFMPLFFFVSAYFTPRSYEKRTPKEFRNKHQLRLYRPAMMVNFVLIPACYFIGQGTAQSQSIMYIAIPGHCWFLLWLLVFNWVYSCIMESQKKHQHQQRQQQRQQQQTMIVATSNNNNNNNNNNASSNKYSFPNIHMRLGIGFLVCGFLMGLFAVIVGHSFFTMPISVGSWICDVVFFVAGILAYENDWLQGTTTLRDKLGCSYIWIHRGMVLIEGTLVVLIFFGADHDELLYGALFLMAGMFCIDMSLMLLEFFQTNANFRSKCSSILGDAAYAVYIFHPLIVTGTTAIFIQVYNHLLYPDNPLLFEDDSLGSQTMLQGPGDGSLYLFLGFIILSIVCNVICWPLGWWIRQLPGFRNSL